MRPLPNHRNLPSIPLKHSTHRPLQLPQNTYKHQITSLLQTQEVIFNAEAIPLLIDLHFDKMREINVQVHSDGLFVKNRSEVVNLPWRLQHEEWVRLTLGEVAKKVEAKTYQNQNKIVTLHTYPSIHLWKKIQQVGNQMPYDYALESVLAQVKNKTTLQSSNLTSKIQSTINTKLKIRGTERANSYTFKAKIASLRGKELSISEWYEARNEIGKSNERRFDSQMLNEASRQSKVMMKRNANTSTQNRSERQKLSQRPARFKHMLQGKIGRAATFDEDIKHDANKPYKPKFYERTPITLEQIELKRKKFESQFICKKTVPIANIHPLSSLKADEVEQSQVMEDIIKAEQSNLMNGFQQTYVNGLQQVNAFVDNEQSGTLCESVFQ